MPHSQTSIGYNKKCIGGFLGDPIPNSPNSHHENCMAESKENDLLALGSKRVSSIHLLVGGVIMLN